MNKDQNLDGLPTTEETGDQELHEFFLRYWYFSCTGDRGTLVGYQRPGLWTMPLMGIELRDVTYEQLAELERGSILVTGSRDDVGMNMCSKYLWKWIFVDSTVLDEWGNDTETVLWFSTDAAIVGRIHMAFE